MKDSTLSLQEKLDMIESKLSCAIGMKETIEYDLEEELDEETRVQLEQALVEYKNIINALRAFKIDMLE